ncbi:GNAT family N-acetyltransferase [Corallincola platygyrae]|uniref:GNAT family N-acetyltransferase n=1 Tax=Corallincola platygyrae TaxID=1193278 RepID=A0ABW4XJN4_9GAMM
MKKEVITYFLQMLNHGQHQPVACPAGFVIQKATHVVPEFNQFMFRAVGGPWRWYSRLSWDYERWVRHLAQPSVTTYTAMYEGSLAGYFELFQHSDNSVELHFFGLLPSFYGKRLGGALLSAAISEAWALNPERVWVHTCSEDHQGALQNYQRRGFELYDQQSEVETLPEDDSEQWLTAPFIYQSLEQARS